jgi:hypothetical protein
MFPKLTHQYTSRAFTNNDFEDKFARANKPGNTIILTITVDEKDSIPEKIKDFLPKAWTEIEAEVGNQGAVKYEGKAQEMNVVTLVGKSSEELAKLAEKTSW